MIIIKIGFIGAGKVGFTLGKYLKENGVFISGYYSRTSDSSFEASRFTESKQFFLIEDILNECDVIFITVSDEEIINVYNSLKKLNLKNKILCHCSGSLSKNIFSDINSHGAYGYSIHPLFPINNKFNSYKSFHKAYITIEGDNKYLQYFYNLFSSFGNEVKIINEKNKKLYHAAAVFSSNLVIPLINYSIKYLTICGFNEKEARSALFPLIESNIKNIEKYGIINSITGPVERGDLEVIKGHVSSIPKEDVNFYKYLSKEVLKLSKSKNNWIDYREMERFLNE